MVRIYLNVRLVMSLVIMHLNVLIERKSVRESLILEDLGIVYMLKKMRNLMKKLRVKVTMS